MNQLSKRQNHILTFINNNGPVSNHDIKNHLALHVDNISRITIVRELDFLIKCHLIEKLGAGRSTQYQAKESLLRHFDPELYFQADPDERNAKTSFNFDIFDSFSTIFSDSELAHLSQLTQRYQHNISSISPDIYRKEIERLTIELSWKSSQIEGNTYSLLDTELLIKENIEAKGHSKQEAIMILNHKTALDYIFEHTQDYTQLSIRKIEDIHQLLINNLDISSGLRHSLVRITGTNYCPLDNKQQIKEALEKSIRCINHYQDPFHQSLTALALISYIQPFSDGNKRSARLVSNAILSAGKACPLSFRSINSLAYKKAMLLFYEKNSLAYLKSLYIKQYEFSVKNYFLTSAPL